MMNGKNMNDILKILKEKDANLKTYSQLKMFENETKVISEKNSNNLSVKEIQKGSYSNRRKRIQERNIIGMQKERAMVKVNMLANMNK